MFWYNKETMGFYHEDINADALYVAPCRPWPFDGGDPFVYVGNEKHEALMDAQANGAQIQWDENTETVVAVPVLPDEEIRNRGLRSDRDIKLTTIYSPAIEQLFRWFDSAEGDTAALAYYKAQRSTWHAWADALCDLPGQSGWPWPGSEVPWPEQPPKPTRYEAP